MLHCNISYNEEDTTMFLADVDSLKVDIARDVDKIWGA